ncbi:hypothetical protein BHE74_00044710 [Ensete ventricosum]|nr:hypothetical protein BHE74_00044710 [Ensete ventricosum]
MARATRRGAATYGQTPYRGGIHGQATYRGIQLWPGPPTRAIACGQALWRGGQAARDNRQWQGLPVVRATAPRNDLKQGHRLWARHPPEGAATRGQWRSPAGRGSHLRRSGDGGPLEEGRKG